MHEILKNSGLLNIFIQALCFFSLSAPAHNKIKFHVAKQQKVMKKETCKEAQRRNFSDINGSTKWQFYIVVKDFRFAEGRDRHFNHEAQRGAGQRP